MAFPAGRIIINTLMNLIGTKGPGGHVRLSRFSEIILAFGFVALPAFGQLTPIPQPTAAYTSATSLVPITVPDGTTVTSLTNGSQTITLGSVVPSSSIFAARTVPSGGWSTWGAPPNTESSTPRVVATYTATTSLTLTLAVPATTFGFEVEPDSFAVFTISADFYSGARFLGTVSQSINGSAGALLAAGSSAYPITSVVITAPSGANGFAMAQFRSGGAVPGVAIPTLSSTVLMGLGGLLAAAGALLAQAQKRPRAVRPY
jgi:hypothetical protein